MGPSEAVAMKQLRDDILTALKRSTTLEELLEVVHRYKNRGANQKDTYDTLEALWIELGCQGTDDETPTCSLLGAVMDRVWGYCSVTDSIWGTALSNERELK
jgi:hypothetical protein